MSTPDQSTSSSQLNTLWRSLFTEPKYQLLLSSGCLLFVENTIRLLATTKTIDPNDAERSIDTLKRSRFSDLTETTKALFWRFAPLCDEDGLGEQRFGRLLFLCRNSISDDPEMATKVRYYELNLVEVERLYGVLRHCRNVSAHELRPRTDFGWCLLVPSTVLRALEVCELPVGSDDLADELRQLCIHIINVTLGVHAVGQEFSISSVCEGPTHQNELHRALNFLGTLISRETGGFTDFEGSSSEYPVTDSAEFAETDDSSLIEAISMETEREAISTEQLRQRLLETKQKIDSTYGVKEDWPGPEANMLQRAIINDVIMHHPRSIDDWVRMPDTAWRYQKHKTYMDRQIEKHWTEIEALIQETIWST